MCDAKTAYGNSDNKTVCTKRYDCTEMHCDNCHTLSYTDTNLFFNGLFIIFVCKSIFHPHCNSLVTGVSRDRRNGF